MKWLERFFTPEVLFRLHMLLATAALAIAFVWGADGNPVALAAAFGMVVVGAFWFYANQRNAHGLEFLLFMAYILAALVVIFLLPAPSWLALVAVVAALGAWDLDYFLQRLKIIPPEKAVSADQPQKDFRPLLGVAHLRRLALAEGLGLLFGIAGLTTRLQLNFWVEVFLALLAAIALSRVIAYLRSQNR